MILVFGGAFNGKLGFVKEEFEVSEEDIFYCNEDKINFSKKVICGLHKFTYFNVTKEKSSIEFIKNNIKLFKNKIIICDDISSGIVPLKKKIGFGERKQESAFNIYQRNPLKYIGCFVEYHQLSKNNKLKEKNRKE